MSIMDRIDHLRANTVTDQEFEKLWGKSMDEHMARIMDHVKEFDAKLAASKKK